MPGLITRGYCQLFRCIAHPCSSVILDVQDCQEPTLGFHPGTSIIPEIRNSLKFESLPSPSHVHGHSMIATVYIAWLVVWNMNFIFPFSWDCHHPNWRSHIFQRGGSTTNQLLCLLVKTCFTSLLFDLIPMFPGLFVLNPHEHLDLSIPCIGGLSHRRTFMTWEKTNRYEI
jgi:hypothetical protein